MRGKIDASHRTVQPHQTLLKSLRMHWLSQLTPQSILLSVDRAQTNDLCAASFTQCVIMRSSWATWTFCTSEKFVITWVLNLIRKEALHKECRTQSRQHLTRPDKFPSPFPQSSQCWVADHTQLDFKPLQDFGEEERALFPHFTTTLSRRHVRAYITSSQHLAAVSKL